VLLTSGAANASATEPSTRQVRVEAIDKPDIEIFMRVDATKHQIATVRNTLERQRGAVGAFAYLDKQAAYAEFKRIFRDKPDLVAKTKPSDLPVSFRVELVEPEKNASSLLSRFEGAPGIDYVAARSTAAQLAADRKRAQLAECGGDPNVALTAYLDVAATRDDEQRVEAALRALPGVAEIRYVSHDEALRRFRCIFINDPNASKTQASELPASYDVVLAPSVVKADVARAIAAIVGANNVTVR